MAATVSLAQMVDLALGTPEVGAVNFNVLHTLLHAMLNKLDLSSITTELSPEDRDLLTSDQSNKTLSQNGELTTDNQSIDQKDTDKSGQDGTQGGGVATKKTPYHVLQQKVARLEEQMKKLNELPSNQDLFDRSKGGDGERPRPVADMWQNVQLKNRVDANEEGIGKLMSLVEDLMAEMSKIKDESKNLRTDLDNHNIPGLRTDLDDMRKKMEELDIQSLRDFMDKLKKELEKLANRMDNMADLDAMMKRLKDLETLANSLNDKLSEYPDASDFKDYVTWKSLEEALRGLRDDLEPKERIVIEMQTQTSRPASAKEPSRPPSSTGPSEELTRMLEDLGVLTKRHDEVEVRVDKLEEEMPNKADKADLAGLSTGGPVDVPDDLLQQLKDLQDQLKVLSKARDKDSEALSRLQQIVLQLQAELDRLNQTAQKLTDENNNQTKQIEGLLVSSDKMDRIKADKEYVQSEVDVKADKRLVEGKVNRSVFDETTDELNRMIKELLDKLGGKEDEWKKAIGTLNEDVDGKLDRLEFGPIRDELERRLKALARQLRELSMRDGDLEDDAAGIRRQLLQRYNCISCDRPVDMMPQGPIPSIPAPQGLPATRSTRPYTTFELEQIRQHARSCRKNATNFKEALLQKRVIRYRMQGICVGATSANDSVAEENIAQMNKVLQQPGVEVVDLYATARACGGGHTMTQPHRRITRVAQYNSLFRDEEIAAPVTREELDIQGADGHIYKGRIEARLPTTLQQSAPGALSGPRQSGQSPKMSHKIIYAQTGGPRAPGTAPVPTPPTSTNMGATRSPPRPSSARVIKPSPVVPKQATIPTAGVVEPSSEPPATQT